MSTRARVKLRIARKKKVAKQQKRVAGAFWRDVAGYKKLLGGTHKDAVAAVRGSNKWVNKRWNRMSKKRRDLASQEVWKGGIKKTIIERAMYRHGIKDENRAKDWWEARGSE